LECDVFLHGIPSCHATVQISDALVFTRFGRLALDLVPGEKVPQIVRDGMPIVVRLENGVLDVLDHFRSQARWGRVTRGLFVVVCVPDYT
jgi:hypothetical protein